MWIVNDFRNFNQCDKMLAGAQPIDAFGNLVLKKKITPVSLYYGLYLEERLVAYYWLLAIRHLPNTYMGSEFHVIEEFQGKGIGTALYEYILLEDHYIVISNHVHTKYSSAMWDKLQTISSLKVGTYDEIADVIDWNTKPDKAKIYNNDHIHFIVSAR